MVGGRLRDVQRVGISDCRTKVCLYQLECIGCEWKYIGETGSSE